MSEEKRPAMNIFAGNGDTVEFAYPKAGWPTDIERGEKYLTLGHVYLVSSVEVHKSSTAVWLSKFPGVKFNSVQFVDVNVDPIAAAQRALVYYGPNRHPGHKLKMGLVGEAATPPLATADNFRVFYHDSFANESYFKKGFDTIEEARAYVEHQYDGIIVPLRGGLQDKVEVVNDVGDIVRTYGLEE